MKSLLKWVGGKSSILDEVFRYFPTEIENYYEPFIGGGSVLLHLLSSPDHKVKGKIYAFDANPVLISFYQNVQQHPDALIENIKKLVSEYSQIDGLVVNRKPTTIEEACTSQESYYYWIRKCFNEHKERDSPELSAMFFFLNKTCFRGVYREGPNGFNVPFGHYKNPGILDEEHLREVSQLIHQVTFVHMPFEESMELVSEGDFMYLDPPYAPENKASFVSYTASGFSLEKHKELFKMCRETPAKFLMSNSNVELVLEELGMYMIHTIECRRAINSKNPAAKAEEVLILN
jgi:DNA adenine methylase